MNDTRPASGKPVFHTTRWTMVMQAQGDAPEARAALSDLCAAYWMPVCRFLRREGRNEDESRELTQEFFARLLSGGSIGNADPAKGRFRSYLLGALKHFLQERRRNEARQKRGGGAVIESIDQGPDDDSPALEIDDPSAAITDAAFDREWALAVMERAFEVVKADFARAGKGQQFEVLKPWLMGDTDKLSQAGAAATLGSTTGAVKVMVHRIRKDFRDAIHAELAQTVKEPEDVAEELRYLIEALS